MTRFPFLSHHKGALIFQIKRPLFWKNDQICPSLPEQNEVILMDLEDLEIRDSSQRKEDEIPFEQLQQGGKEQRQMIFPSSSNSAVPAGQREKGSADYFPGLQKNEARTQEHYFGQAKTLATQDMARNLLHQSFFIPPTPGRL